MLILISVLALLCQGVAATSSHYQLYLDQDGRYDFQWSVDYQKQLIHIQITVMVTNQSWLAFGFSDDGGVLFADLAVLWTNGNGKEHLLDSFTDKEGILYLDDQQDYQMSSVSSNGSTVLLQFQRAFNTCDKQDYLLDNGTTNVIYTESSQATDSPFGSDMTRLHSGFQRAQLLKPDIPHPKLPSDAWIFEVKVPQIHVPAKETTYWWHTALLPVIDMSHHIVQYEGIIAAGNEDLVHHMEVFHCELSKGDKIPFYSGPGLSEGKPRGLGPCRKVLGAWAMGAQAMVYPEDAGVPIGGPGYSRFALLEVHYNNPKRLPGRMDSSGIRFYVTAQLRKYEAGIMELGLEYVNKMAIPASQENFKLTGYCVHQCTEVGLPEGGVYVFASQLHTHQVGKRVYTKHVRQSRELPELNRDNHYSSHLQEIRRLPHLVHILPGDELITTCEYDTSTRDHVTVGGFSISDEMCVNYIHYYPRAQLEVCKSSVQTRALDTFILLINRFGGADVYPGAGDRQNYESINWTPTNVYLLRYLYDTSPLSMQCNKSDGTRFPGDWEEISISKITKPFLILPRGQC